MSMKRVTHRDIHLPKKQEMTDKQQLQVIWKGKRLEFPSDIHIDTWFDGFFFFCLIQKLDIFLTARCLFIVHQRSDP